MAGEGEQNDWTRSVEADLDKTQVKFKSLLFEEAEANLAVVLAEADVEKITRSHDQLSKSLKTMHVEVMQSVNNSEALLVHALSGDVDSVSLSERTSDYATALNERAETIYKCATTTLESRRCLARAEEKSNMCKRHLVDLVGNRNEAESEMERIHKILADNEKATATALGLALAPI